MIPKAQWVQCAQNLKKQFCVNITKGENMSYTALYRKFRPTSFEQVKGQDHIVQTLKNQINANRIGHAYLFCGMVKIYGN